MPNALQSATNFPDPWPGGTWRPRDIMRLEMTASRAVLSMAAKYRERYLRNFYELGRRAVEGTNKIGDAEIAYVIPAGQGKDEAVAKLIGALVEQGVEVHRLERKLGFTIRARSRQQISFAAGYAEDGTQRTIGGSFFGGSQQEIQAGSYIVFLAQPYRANVLTLFEPQVYPDRRTAGGEAERPYDVAGWTLPMQMGVQTIPVHSIREAASERRLTLVRDANEVRQALNLPLRRGTRSPLANPITRPARLALYKSWTGSMDEGWTRYVFDTFNVPFQSLLDREVRAGNLRAKYDVIVLPSMRLRDIVEGRDEETAPAEFTGGISEAGVENLRRFVETGGTLVCFDAAAELAVKRFKLPLKNVLEGVKSSEFYGPGSILRLTVDTAHPLARGFAKDVDAYFINSSAYELTDAADKRVRVVARYAERDVLRSGWLLGEKLIAGKIALAEVAFGKGRIVIFAFRPQHRAQTWGTFPFIWNAIELRDEGGGMRDESRKTTLES